MSTHGYDVRLVRGSARIPCPAPWHVVQRIECLAARDCDAGNDRDTGRFVYVSMARTAEGEEGGVSTDRLEYAEHPIARVSGATNYFFTDTPMSPVLRVSATVFVPRG
jgi:hypothetical protein